MQDFFRRHIRLILVITGVVFVGLITWGIIYTFVIFHITSTHPAEGKISIYQPTITVTFNKKLISKDLSVKINDLQYETNIKDNTLTVSPLSYMVIGKKYTLTINSISSESNDVLKNKTITFTASDDSSLLDDDAKRIILERQDNKSGLYSDPIYNYLPYSTLDYSISVSGGTSDDDKAVITITVELSAADVKINRDAAIQQYRQKAMDYLNSLKDITISTYQIDTRINDPTL